MRTRQRAAVPAVLAAAALVAATSRVAAQGPPHFVVNDLGDASDSDTADGICASSPGHCTLRAAIEQLNALPADSNAGIDLPAGTITLGSPLGLHRPVTIHGGGRSATFVSGADTTLAFSVLGAGSVYMFDLTIENGNGTLGGGIRVGDSTYLSLVDVNIAHCSAEEGGGISTTGPLNMTRCRVTDCHATGTIGGAIELYDGSISSATLTDCAFDGNDSVHAGGAIYVFAGYGLLHLYDSTLSGNSSGTSGGAIYAAGGTITMEYTTITNNTAGVASGGGGVWLDPSSTVSAQFSIIAGNYEPNVSHFLIDGDCTGAFTSVGTNLLGAFGASHCQITGTHVLADPLLGPLQDNGGPTPTHALHLDSPALGASDCGSATYVHQLHDQRQVNRVQNGMCDLGAFERTPCGDANLDTLVDVSDVFFLINTLFAGGPASYGYMDANGDGKVDVADVFFLVNFLFALGATPSCLGS